MSASPTEHTDGTIIDINNPKEVIRAQVIDVLRTICDPEIPVNIYDLGLIYSVELDDQMAVKIKMTLTSPGCPVAQTFPGEVAQKVQTVSEVTGCDVELVWDPPWSMANLSEEARVMLGIF